jgi:hypothetical protein
MPVSSGGETEVFTPVYEMISLSILIYPGFVDATETFSKVSKLAIEILSTGILNFV